MDDSQTRIGLYLPNQLLRKIHEAAGAAGVEAADFIERALTAAVGPKPDPFD